MSLLAEGAFLNLPSLSELLYGIGVFGAIVILSVLGVGVMAWLLVRGATRRRKREQQRRNDRYRMN